MAVLPYREARDEEDEKHVHPLQLDVIRRCRGLRSNPGETVLTPFMGVGSEVYAAVELGRRGIGAELKPSYYRQAVKNLASILDAAGMDRRAARCRGRRHDRGTDPSLRSWTSGNGRPTSGTGTICTAGVTAPARPSRMR